MCQMNIVLDKGSDQFEVVLENASLLEVTDDGIRVSSLFDPPRIVSGVKVVKIDFMNGKVVLENTGA